MRVPVGLLIVVLALAACSPAPPESADSTTSSTAPSPSTTTSVPSEDPASTSTTFPSTAFGYPLCYHESWPTAPEDWYRDTPVYVFNNAPTDELRRFASGIPGFVTVWTDRDHNGWATAGFVDTDVEELQGLLEAEFPDDGVVAVELQYTREELEEMASEIQAQLLEPMHVLGAHEIWGRIEVFIGLLTQDNADLAASIAGDAPYCLVGLDPIYHDQSPQALKGDGWVFLGVVSGWPESETPRVITDKATVDELWASLGFEGTTPAVEFATHVVVAFPVVHSGSCPDQRFDGLRMTPDRILPEIRDVTIAMMCTADANPRTFLIGVERAILPPPPVRWAGSEYESQALEVSTDLRTSGSILEDTDSRMVEIERPRVASGMPLVMEPGFPWQLIVPADCDLTYLGEVNGVGWHLAPDSEVPASWAGLAVDGLIDLQIELIQEPDPMVILAGAGQEAVYLPGEKPTEACRP